MFVLTTAALLSWGAFAWSRQHGEVGMNEESGELQDLTDSGELSAPREEKPVVKSDSDWLSSLKPERYKVLRQGATERPFTGELLTEIRDGWYVCHACGLPLFKSDSKFESHCGWPSFDHPAAYANVRTKVDRSMGMVRTEIVCARCGSHLGHVFEDGPTATGLRYCVNSLSLDFKPMPARKAVATDTAVFAAGCFWGVEKLFYETPGVLSTTVGYTGGHFPSPTYKQVSSGSTGHAEAVEVVFDPARVSYGTLAKLFFLSHDPTTLNRQGPDHGEQYRSAVFFRSPEQEKEAKTERDSLVAAKTWRDPVVTEFVQATRFWKAEDYHQKWFLTHPVYCHRPAKV
jgi:peptide methionine sulfoxide reductase msrA/msrB